MAMERTWLGLLHVLLGFTMFGAVPPDPILPCVYEGNLQTEREWYGFLANVTIITTGRMTFQFTYPADRCCQNILFYMEDQISILNARMNCWQKEGLLRPEDDQILRLTPRFSWSGCHMTHPGGVATYVCSGGRSFTGSGNDKPSTWYVAASNCASLGGLLLKYRLEVVGHIGECKNGYRVLTTTPAPLTPAEVGASEKSTIKTVTDKTCVMQGKVNVSVNWYGFLGNVSLLDSGGFRFEFSFPISQGLLSVVLYDDDDIEKLVAEQSCWQKRGVIKQDKVQDQIMHLTTHNSWNGCVTQPTASGGHNIVCKGQRKYESARKIYFAIMNCHSRIGLYLKYRFEFFGYQGRPCSSASNTFGHIFPGIARTRYSCLIQCAVILVINYIVYFIQR